MSTQVQYRRGTNAQNAAFTGALGEITVDTTNGTLRVHDGITAGGSNIATVSYVTAQISSLSSNSISDGTSNVRVFNNGNVVTSVGGVANVFNVTSTGAVLTGDLTVTGNATLSGNILGDRIQNGTTQIDIQTQNGNANITVAGTSNVAVFASTGLYVTGVASVTGNITAGNVSATNLTGTLSTASQPNITSVGTLGSLTVTANITGGNIDTAGQISATGNISGGNLVITGGIVDTGALTIVTGSNGNVAITPNGTGILTVSTAASVTGNITGGNLSVGTGTISGGNIVNTNANGIGNIGSATTYFNTVFAKATSAQYADLAEMYVADSNYAPGTVVEFGGEFEITISTQSHSTAVAGIISTNPSYLMNSTQEGQHVLPVALTGRVPCQVQGPVKKGDVLVASATPGVAQRIGVNWQPGCVLGKSLETVEENTIKIIEVAVGRF